MNNLYHIFTQIFEVFSFSLVILCIISVLFAISVITNKNPVVSVLFLIGLFISVAIYLIIVNVSFIGLAYLLVYVGAVSILFLFILMLINVRVSELTTETKNSIPLVFLVTLVFGSLTYTLLPEIKSILDIIKNTTFTNLLPNWDNSLAQIGDISSIGNTMYSNYGILLIVVSIILLLAMIGAIAINTKLIKKVVHNVSRKRNEND